MSDPTSAERFARIPYAFLDDPAFAEVYENDIQFATWVRLWMAADNAWPAPAPIPRSVNAEAFTYLVTVGLVTAGRSDHYRMVGMDDMQVARPGGAGGRARAAIASRSRGRFTSDPVQHDTSTLDQHADTSTLDQPSGTARHVTSLHSTSPADGSKEPETTTKNGTDGVLPAPLGLPTIEEAGRHLAEIRAQLGKRPEETTP